MNKKSFYYVGIVGLVIVSLVGVFFLFKGKDYSELESQKRSSKWDQDPSLFREFKTENMSFETGDVVMKKTEALPPGEYLVRSENKELGLGERVVFSGFIIEVPDWDSEKEQVVGRMYFPHEDGGVEANILFGQLDSKIGVRWAPGGDVTSNTTWTAATVGEVIKKINLGDQLVIHVFSNDSTENLLISLRGDVLEDIGAIGPVIQLIVGDYS